VARVVAWIGICSIIILTVVPANDRPTLTEDWLGETTGHLVDHVLAFSLASAAFAVGYCRFSLAQLVLLAFCYCGGIELIQVPLPTRHARLSDFIIDFATASVTMIIARFTQLAA
jgi:VanZ family protein